MGARGGDSRGRLSGGSLIHILHRGLRGRLSRKSTLAYCEDSRDRLSGGSLTHIWRQRFARQVDRQKSHTSVAAG